MHHLGTSRFKNRGKLIKHQCPGHFWGITFEAPNWTIKPRFVDFGATVRWSNMDSMRASTTFIKSERFWRHWKWIAIEGCIRSGCERANCANTCWKMKTMIRSGQTTITKIRIMTWWMIICCHKGQRYSWQLGLPPHRGTLHPPSCAPIIIYVVFLNMI